MARRGIPPPPGFEAAARPSRVPDDASREALPLQVPSAVAPRLLHHVHQPSYMPHPHTQIPVQPPMMMHNAVRTLAGRTRIYLRTAASLEQKTRACARAFETPSTNDYSIFMTTTPSSLLSLARARCSHHI